MNIIEIPKTPYCYSESQDSILDDLERRVSAMREAGSLSADALAKIRRYFRIKNIYHSNAIEGNTLDVGETRQIVEHGLTITGKPLKDQAEAKNLSEALDFLESLASDRSLPITEADIRQLHLLILKGIDDTNAGAYRSVNVEIAGSAFTPPGPESVSAQMHEFGSWLASVTSEEQEFGAKQAVLQAAVAHTWFVTIHPFIDGNGRSGRLLLNLLLMRAGYPIAVITKDDRLRYYDALEESQASDLSAFVSLLTESIHESLEEYEKAVEEDREMTEWASSLAERLSKRGEVKARNEYEVWRNAMELLKSYFRQAAEFVDETATFGAVFFKDFGQLEYEKYASLRTGGSAKHTWFFRIDFRAEDRVARYLFFFGSRSFTLRDQCHVTLHVAREEPSGSFHYERLTNVTAQNVPDLFEIGYKQAQERFVVLGNSGRPKEEQVEDIVRGLFDDVVTKHFSSI